MELSNARLSICVIVQVLEKERKNGGRICEKGRGCGRKGRVRERQDGYASRLQCAKYDEARHQENLGRAGRGKYKMVELRGFEPLAYTLRTYRSSQLSYSPIIDF